MSGVLIACHDCDLLQHEPDVPEGGSARCPRCDAQLWRHRPNSIERTLALTVAGIVLFAVANAFPFLIFNMQGQITQTTLSSGVRDLWLQGFYPVSLLVLFTTILTPMLQLGPCLRARAAAGGTPRPRLDSGLPLDRAGAAVEHDWRSS